MEKRDEQLLDAIDNIKTLPIIEQRKLHPLLHETIDRHRKLKRDREVRDKHIKSFLEELRYIKKNERAKNK